MSYLLYCASNISKEHGHIVYNPKEFTDNPITVNVPELVNILEEFINQPPFENAALVEKSSQVENLKPKGSREKPSSPEESVPDSTDVKGSSVDAKNEEKTVPENASGNQQQSREKLDPTSPSLQSLSGGTVFYCQVKELDKKRLQEFACKLIAYLKKSVSAMSEAENFLSREIVNEPSGIKQVIDIRNYLVRYAQSENKSYQKGYLYIKKE